MAEVFKCPSCSAPLEWAGATMQKCEFCGSNVIAPSGMYKVSDLMGGVGSFGAGFSGLGDLAGKAMKVAEIQQLIQSGKKIEAIKLFHDTFGTGLAEAKEAVERMERGEGIDISGMQVISSGSPAPIKVKVSSAWGVRLFVFILVLTIGLPVLITVASLALTGGITWFAMKEADASKGGSARPATPGGTKPSPSPESRAKELLRFGGEGTGPGRFDDNRAVAVSPDGNIFSADRDTRRVQGFDANGKFLWLTLLDCEGYVDHMDATRDGKVVLLMRGGLCVLDAKTGKEEALVKTPSATAMAVGVDGRIYLAEDKGIAVVGLDGKQLSKITFSPDLPIKRVESVAVDALGNVYVLESWDSVVFKLGPSGNLITKFGGRPKPGSSEKSPSMFDTGAEYLEIDPKGRVFVSQVSRVSVFNSDGNYLFDFDTKQAFGMAFNDAGQLVVAERPEIVKYEIADGD